MLFVLLCVSRTLAVPVFHAFLACFCCFGALCWISVGWIPVPDARGEPLHPCQRRLLEQVAVQVRRDLDTSMPELPGHLLDGLTFCPGPSASRSPCERCSPPLSAGTSPDRSSTRPPMEQIPTLRLPRPSQDHMEQVEQVAEGLDGIRGLRGGRPPHAPFGSPSSRSTKS